MYNKCFLFGNTEGRRKPEVVFLYEIAIRSEKSQFIFWISSLLPTRHVVWDQPAITKVGTIGAARETPCRKLIFIWGGVNPSDDPLMGWEILVISNANCWAGNVKHWKPDCPCSLNAFCSPTGKIGPRSGLDRPPQDSASPSTLG